MRFLSIIRSAENQGDIPQGLMDAMNGFIEETLKDGSLVQTGGLAGSAASVRVRSAGGKLTVTDGPFAEAKEVVGGYALLEAPSVEDAKDLIVRFMELHRRHWPQWNGECELRQVEFLAP